MKEIKTQKIKRTLTEEEKTKFTQIFLKLAMSFLFVAIFILAFVLDKGYLYIHNTGYVQDAYGYDFQFHVINVGQGDCLLIKFPDDRVLLVDTGENDAYKGVHAYIKEFFKRENLDRIDYFVLTHQDSDHIGGAGEILRDFKVEKVFRPKVYSKYEQEMGLNTLPYNICTTESYNNFARMLLTKNINFLFNESGISIVGDNYTIQFLAPTQDTYSASNDYSAVIMIKVFDKKFLLTGDATSQIEEGLISRYGDNLSAHVLKIAHHGSNTSSSQAFLQAVNPKFALLSVGENSNLLPSIDVLNRLYQQNVTIFSTKKLGSYALVIDKEEILAFSQPLPSKTLPVFACVVILAVCMVWGIKFNTKHL